MYPEHDPGGSCLRYAESKMAEELKVGDVVELKSGGPPMTIEDIGRYNYSDVPAAKCVWFEGKKRHEDVFQIATLQKA